MAALVEQMVDGGWHVHPEIFEDESCVCFTMCAEPWTIEAIQVYCEAHQGSFTIPGAVEVLKSHMEKANHAIPELIEEGLDQYREFHCECPVQPEPVRIDLAHLVEAALEAGQVRAVKRVKKKKVLH